MPRMTRSQSQAQNQLSGSQNQPEASNPPQKPVNETVTRPTDIDLAQVVSWQAQLEEMVENMNQAVNTIKKLLERMAALSTTPTIGGRTTAEGQYVEHQVAKATTRGNATATRRTNSQ